MLPRNNAPRLHQSEMDSSHNSLRDLLQRTERRRDAAFTEFSHKLLDIETRVSAIKQLPSNPLLSPSTPSSSSSEDGKRRRRTPPELQVLHCYVCKFRAILSVPILSLVTNSDHSFLTGWGEQAPLPWKVILLYYLVCFNLTSMLLIESTVNIIIRWWRVLWRKWGQLPSQLDKLEVNSTILHEILVLISYISFIIM